MPAACLRQHRSRQRPYAERRPVNWRCCISSRPLRISLKRIPATSPVAVLIFTSTPAASVLLPSTPQSEADSTVAAKATGQHHTRSPPMRTASGGNHQPGPPPPFQTPADIPCVAALGDSGNNTPNHAPWETASCRHRQPGLRGCGPVTLPQTRSPVCRCRHLAAFQDTKPTTTLGTKRKASGGN